MKPLAQGCGVVRVSLVAAVVCAALAGCTGSLFQSKAAPPSVYLLSAKIAAAPAIATPTTAAPAGQIATLATPAIQPVAVAPPVAQPMVIPVDLAVLRPRVRPGLESDRIAVLYPDRRLDYFADARWSGPLDEVVQDLAVQVFRSGTHLRNVGADASAFASGYWLEIEVADFQAEYTSTSAAPTVHVRLLARLGGAGDRHILASFDASAQQPATDNRLSAIVGAYEWAANAALAEIAENTGHALLH